MATRKRSKKLVLPDVSEEVRSPDTIRSAFEKRRPQIAAPDLAEPPELPTDEAWAAMETFTLFVRACVEALFPDVPVDVPRAFSEWSPAQRALLTAMAELPAEVLINAGDLSDRLERVGAMTMMADDDRYLRRYVGLVDAGPLEREVEGRPLWLWLRLHLMGRVPAQAWLAAAAPFDDGERLELTRLAVNDAYQLLRRWPLPDRITPQQEAEDTACLFDAVLPVLAVLGEPALREALLAELDRPHPDGALVLLLSTVLLERDRGLADLGGELYDDVLTDALSLYAPHGRRLLMHLEPAGRSAVVARMEPVSHDARGFWTYADLLDDAERGARITAALAGFTRACSPSAAPRVKELVSGLGPEHRTGLRAIADGQGPNARLVAEALASIE